MALKGTTICAVLKDGKIAVAGDGQVTMGESTIFKATAKKVRRIYGGKVVTGFAGTVSDAFALCDRFEAKLEQFSGNMERAAVELAQEWRADKAMRKLEAMLIAASGETLMIISGTGEVIVPDDGIAAVGSRTPSQSGKLFANKLGKAAAKSGFTLISGGADGCDCIAEYSATANGGGALLFLAVPLAKRMKNARVAELRREDIICLISDHSPSDSFNAGYALTRNKYIYAAGECAVVCESGAEKGGSYNGAMACINGGYGKVYAYDNKKCYGNQMLIANGAVPMDAECDLLPFSRKR